MKFAHVFFLGLWIYNTKACVFDLPNDAYHACRGIITMIDLPFPKGGVACCERSGSINWASSSDIFGTVRYQCWCPSQNEPSIIAVTKDGKREQDEATTPRSQPIVVNAGLPKSREEILQQHNELRALHRIPPFVLNGRLNKYVQRNTESLARANENLHSDKYQLWYRYRVGENHSDKTGQLQLGPKEDYDPEHPLGWKPPRGQFNQDAWKSTGELGIGRAKTADGQVVIVETYSPGNVNSKEEDKKDVQPKTRLANLPYKI